MLKIRNKVSPKFGVVPSFFYGGLSSEYAFRASSGHNRTDDYRNLLGWFTPVASEFEKNCKCVMAYGANTMLDKYSLFELQGTTVFTLQSTSSPNLLITWMQFSLSQRGQFFHCLLHRCIAIRLLTTVLITVGDYPWAILHWNQLFSVIFSKYNCIKQ